VKRQLVARYFRGTRGIAIKIRAGRKLPTNLALTLPSSPLSRDRIYVFGERFIGSLIKQAAESEISSAFSCSLEYDSPGEFNFRPLDDSHLHAPDARPFHHTPR